MSCKRQSDLGPTPPAAHAATSIAWNYAGYACQIAFNLGLTWYIVRKITVVEYGLFLFVMSFSATLYLLDMGMSSVLVQAYVEASSIVGKDRVNELLGASFVALGALGAIGAFIFCGLALFLPGPFKIPPLYLHEASLVFIVAAFIVLVGLPTIAVEQVYQASHRFDRLNQVQLVTTFFLVALSILVLAAGYGIVALAVVQLVVSCIRLIALIAWLPASVPGARLNPARFNSGVLKPLLHLSKWAFLGNLSGSLFDMLVWLILGSLSSMREVALFGLAGKPTRQLWNFVDRGSNVTLPLLSKAAAEGDSARLRQTYFGTVKLVLGAVLPFIILGFVFARPFIVVWAGSQYAGAVLVMRWLLLAALAQALAYPSDLVLYACGEVKQATKISAWSSAIGILAALLLVTRYGAAGLAAGMAVAQIVFNCGWFAWAACRISGASLAALVRSSCQGLLWPLVVLVAEIVIARGFWSHLSALALVLFAIAAGLVYLAFWGLRTVLPLYRGYAEAVAQ